MNNKIVVGYSLDSVLLAREMAETGASVIFLESGLLGHPLDTLRDYIDQSSMQRIKKLDPSVSFLKLVNDSYAFFPYEQLEFVNSHNGLISFPLNKKSFESAEEWEQIEGCVSHIDEFHLKLEQATNYINIYKKFFPKWIYDSVIKYIGINKWGGIKQAKFTKDGLAQEISLSFLGNSGTGVCYRPEVGYQELCKRLLVHSKIKHDTISLPQLKEFIIKRQKNFDVTVCDNRIDNVCAYAHGKFDRVVFRDECEVDVAYEELMDVDDGIVLTPMKEYWAISNETGNKRKIFSSLVEEMSFDHISVLPPTLVNKKIYGEYKKLLNLYSGKQLNLDLSVKTILL